MGSGGEPVSLAQALQAVRDSCKRAQKPAKLSNRLDFLEERERKALLGPPLECVTRSALHEYTDECGGHLPPTELAYFLPRICDLLAEGKPLNPSFGWGMGMTFLSYASFPDAWPSDRADAMQAFCAALLVDFAQEPSRFQDDGSGMAVTLGTMLSAMTNGGIDAARLTAALDAADQQAVAAAIAHWIEEDAMFGDRSLDTFLGAPRSEPVPATAHIRSWLAARPEFESG